MSEAVTTTSQESEETTNWRSIPQIAVVVGLVLCIYGVVQDKQQFAFSYLTAFMFFLSLGFVKPKFFQLFTNRFYLRGVEIYLRGMDFQLFFHCNYYSQLYLIIRYIEFLVLKENLKKPAHHSFQWHLL